MIDFHSFLIASALSFSVASAVNSTEFICPTPDGQFADALDCSAYYKYVGCLVCEINTGLPCLFRELK
jgi:hypothetical protein